MDPFETDPPRQALPFLTAEGRAGRGGFADLPATRAATLDRLAELGVTAERLPSDLPLGADP